MTAYIIRRLLQMIPLIFGVTFLTFALINLIPGSPVARLRDNPKIRPEAAIELERQLGLDKPWPERYVRWLGDLAQGDLGVSLYNRLPVADRIWAVIPNTLLLAVLALTLALLVAVPLGVYSAVRHGSLFDRSASVGAVAMYAMPDFWLALLLVILFSLKFREWGLAVVARRGHGRPPQRRRVPGPGRASHPAGGGAGPGPDRLLVGVLPLVDAGDAEPGIRAHRPRKGSAEPDHPLCPRLQERLPTLDHHRRTGAAGTARRRLLHRDHLRLAGDGAADFRGGRVAATTR